MRVIVIGIDGADWSVMNPLLSEGVLPTIEGLIDSGISGVLKSVIPPISPPAWASMITGVYPDKHGIHDFVEIQSDYRRTVINRKRLKAHTVWNILNDCGISTGMVKIPVTYPPEIVNGYIVTGMLTPGNSEVFSYPREIGELIGKPIDNWNIGAYLIKESSYSAFLEEIEEKTKRQVDLILRLYDQSPVEFFMTVFDGCDRVQHFFWKFHDKEHPRYNDQSDDTLKMAIANYYKCLDNYLYEILERHRNNCNILIVSDHGFCSLQKDFYIEQWLKDKKYLTTQTQLSRTFDKIKTRSVQLVYKAVDGIGLKSAVKDIVPRSFANHMGNYLRDDSQKLRQHIIWKKSKVSLTSSAGQCLRINLANRDELGIVDSEAECRKLTEVIKRELMSIIDPDSKSRVVRNVYYKDEIHRAPSDDGPDIIIELNDGYALQEGYSKEYLRSSTQYGKDRSGYHRREGIFIASGPDIQESKENLELDIVDIAPTILYLNGLDIPQYMDGKVITSAMKEPFSTNHPIRYTAKYGMLNAQEQIWKNGEARSVEEHLRRLGYLD